MARIPDEANMFRWEVFIEGPGDTPYEGGIFQLEMTFPKEYPMLPPQLRFISEFWHPNGTLICCGVKLLFVSDGELLYFERLGVCVCVFSLLLFFSCL
jgi:Ubiquitin-conjugating enzyme